MIKIKRFISFFLAVVNMFIVPFGSNHEYFINKSLTVEIDETVEYQTVSGFGASAAWWAQNAGDSQYADEVAKALYSKDGLGLSVYRYNVGGGEADNPNARISGSRATESFYVYNEETDEYEYDFTRDAAAQAMLDKCLKYGCIDTVVLFANSPHYSMTASGSACGSYSDNTSNLPAENYEAYADYFITITKYFVEKGVPVKFISPVNEPQWSWGGAWVGQEGCHYEKEEVVALYKVFARKLKASGLDVKLMGPESGEIGESTEWYFENLYGDPEIRDVLGSLAYHSYWSDNNSWGKENFGTTVSENYSDISVDMTEWCELPCEHDITDFDGALLMAKVITQDLALSNANSWSAWVGVNNYAIGDDGKMYSDGLLVADDDFTELYTAERYSALAHFSKYVTPGSVRIYSNHSRLIAPDTAMADYQTVAFKTPEGKTVLIILNNGENVNIATNMLFGTMEVITSTADAQLQNVYSGKTKIFVECPADSITTIIYG